jgi:hypothetical protein
MIMQYSVMEYFALACLLCALIPCLLFLWNITLYRKLPQQMAAPLGSDLRLSVLIPARNEEKNIEASLRSILSNDYNGFEVIVMNDHSSDNTAAIVERLALSHPNLRLVDAPPLPAGWCGKQHACYQLAKLAKGDLIAFLDADVRLSSDALVRMVGFMDNNKAALASGVPRQVLGSFADKLLIPQIHFVLLGFLPLWAMRRFKMASMSGGCGQLFVAQKLAYDSCGGHALLPESLHDGLKLPRAFREAGYPTDLFDATDIASCKMYSSNEETLLGLGKNAHEGLGAKGTIIPMTVLLVLGQVVPLVLLILSIFDGSTLTWQINAAVIASYLPRIIAVDRFKQPVSFALLHPISILGLLAIQWMAFIRHRSGKPSSWKGRTYIDVKPAQGH